MVYETERMQLKSVRIVRKNPINDIVICQDAKTADGNLYTLLVVKDHETAKLYLEVFEEAKDIRREAYIDSFSSNGYFCMVFPYKQERPLRDFYMGEAYSLAECEEVCINLILSCITANVPYPILYLMLKQEQIHFAKDHSVYFSYQIDLAELDKKITEQDCVIQCARLLMELLKSKETQKATSYVLLRKKIDKRGYQKFTELYKDVRIAAVPKKKKGVIVRIKAFFVRHRDLFFKILLRICIVLAVIVLISFISQLIFGEVIWLRLFINGFKIIGTESLVQ